MNPQAVLDPMPHAAEPMAVLAVIAVISCLMIILPLCLLFISYLNARAEEKSKHLIP